MTPEQMYDRHPRRSDFDGPSFNTVHAAARDMYDKTGIWPSDCSLVAEAMDTMQAAVQRLLVARKHPLTSDNPRRCGILFS